MFSYSKTDLCDLATNAIAIAKRLGASAAEVDFSESLGQAVNVRLQEIEQIEYQQDKSMDITVFHGQHKGRASSADFSEEALTRTIQAALDIAKHTGEDACSGLADADCMATQFYDLDLYHPWQLSVEDAIDLAKECEESALNSQSQLNNSEGASVNTGHHQYTYANSHGFLGYEVSSRHSLSCVMVTQDDSGMQRDYWYDMARSQDKLASAQDIGQMAALRAVRRLGSKAITTGKYPVVFDATIANSLIGHLLGGLSGGNLYRQTSFLCDSLGKNILSDIVHLSENPHIVGGLSSANFDAEGVATQKRVVIDGGVVNGYFLGSYSARKLGMTTTGNAGGAHNLFLQPTVESQSELLKKMGTGLLVTELMGQGVNMLTGDYSRGAAGFWVENGVIVHPVEEITIASNLKDMFKGIVGIGNDTLKRSANHIGSILIDKMTVASQ